MIVYFLRSFLAQIRNGKMLFALSIFGVALGVASVLSIQIINRNALSAFRGSVKAVTGDADLSVVSRAPSLDETVFPRVLSAPDVAAAWPMVRTSVALLGEDAVFLDLVGVDLFLSTGVPLSSSVSDESTDLGAVLPRVLSVPGWVAVTPSFALERGWSVGDSIRVSSGAAIHTLWIGALIDFQQYSPFASRKLALMDIAQAQSLFGRRGEIQEIQVRLVEGADNRDVAESLQRTLGKSVLVLTPEAREAKVTGLLEAFRLNLTALSLVSLFVGVFLIYTSIQTGLVRRRAEFGLLRSMGSTRGQVLGLILGEVLVLGTLGTALGIPLGYYAATLNVDQVSATLTSIYLLNEIETLEIPPTLYVLAVLVGVGGALLGGLWPALDISRRDTRSLLVSVTLREKVTRLAPRLAGLGGTLIGVLLAWFLTVGHQQRWGGFALGFVMLVVLPMFTPQLILFVCNRVAPGGFGLRYSLKTLALKVQTTAFAVASLAVAVSMLIAVTLLIGSFRRTLETWLDTSIRADVYITTESWAREGRLAVMTPELLDALESFPGVEATEVLRQFRVYSGESNIALAGVRFASETRKVELPLYRGDMESVLRGLAEGGALVGEPLARKRNLEIGDSLAVSTADGEHTFAVVGVTYDYSEAGSALIDLREMERIFGEAPINNIALFLEPGRDVERVVDALQDRFSGAPLLFRSNRRLRSDVMDIFDQTFAITRLLQLMALTVAAAGVSLTLLVLARERVAELALYRALGAMRRQVFRIFVGEGLAIGVLGLILGVGGGVGLAALLIYVINPTYFGWTIRPAVPWAEMAQETITILVVSTAAALYPAVRASRMPVRELSRDDL